MIVKLLYTGYVTLYVSYKTIISKVILQLYESTVDNVKCSIDEDFDVCNTTSGSWTSVEN